MHIYLLTDYEDMKVDAVIMAETATIEEIREAIAKVKARDEYGLADILFNLPADCKVYSKLYGNVHSVYY